VPVMTIRRSRSSTPARRSRYTLRQRCLNLPSPVVYLSFSDSLKETFPETDSMHTFPSSGSRGDKMRERFWELCCACVKLRQRLHAEPNRWAVKVGTDRDAETSRFHHK